MNMTISKNHEDHHPSNTPFGFWIYLMSDCVLFATLFATYAVLSPNVFGGPSGKELFNLNYILISTFILLISSLTCGLAIIASYKKSKKETIILFIVTFILGIIFLIMEFKEFIHLIHTGNGPDRNAFLSSFFTLVGTHGLHVLCGCIWLIMLMIQIYKFGFSKLNQSKIACFGLFWHFLDLVWIFVFTIVYLFSAI